VISIKINVLWDVTPCSFLH